MENLNKTKLGILTILGMIGSFFADLFGGWDTALQTLLIFMAVDFAMGWIVAGVFKKSKKSENGALNSYASWKGLCKKGVTLLVVLIATRLDMLLGSAFIRTAAIISYILNETLSITENAGLMGIYIPPVIAKAIDVLRSKEAGAENEKNIH